MGLRSQPADRGISKGLTTLPYMLGLLSSFWCSAPQVGDELPRSRDHFIYSHHSMLFPNNSTPFPKNTSPPPHPLPVPSFRNRRLDRDGFCAPSTHRLRFSYRSMPPLFLEPGVSCNGRLYSHDIRPRRRRHRDVLRNKGRRAYARQRIRYGTRRSGARGSHAHG